MISYDLAQNVKLKNVKKEPKQEDIVKNTPKSMIFVLMIDYDLTQAVRLMDVPNMPKQEGTV